MEVRKCWNQMCWHTPPLPFWTVDTERVLGFFPHSPTEMVQCGQKMGCENDVIPGSCFAGAALPTRQFGILDVAGKFWCLFPSRWVLPVWAGQGAGAALRELIKGAHYHREGQLQPGLHPQRFSMLPSVLPFTALCDACGFSKQKMFMRRVYFKIPFMTAQTPLQADGLTVARKPFISQK